jgi:hypothetical protein
MVINIEKKGIRSIRMPLIFSFQFLSQIEIEYYDFLFLNLSHTPFSCLPRIQYLQNVYYSFVSKFKPFANPSKIPVVRNQDQSPIKIT